MITTASVVPSCLVTDVYHCAHRDHRADSAHRIRERSSPLLALGEEVVAPVPRPAALVVLGAHWSFLPKGHRGHSIRGDALGHQIAHGRLGAALAESQVVLGGAALVSVAFDPHELVRICLEPGRAGIERFCVTRPNQALVEVEIHRLGGRFGLVVGGGGGSRGGGRGGGQGGGWGGRRRWRGRWRGGSG